MVVVTWWLQLKMRSRSSFDGFLAIVYPLFFATTVFFMYRRTATRRPSSSPRSGRRAWACGRR